MSKKTDITETINNDVAKEEVKEEPIPAKVQEAYDSLMPQVKKFNEEKMRASTMEIKALGVLEVLVQMYPKLQEKDSEG